MRYRHNTEQNQSIVNAIDNASTLLAARTLANSGKGTMKVRRSTTGNWCSMAILTIFTAGYGTVAADGFKSLKIRG